MATKAERAGERLAVAREAMRAARAAVTAAFAAVDQTPEKQALEQALVAFHRAENAMADATGVAHDVAVAEFHRTGDRNAVVGAPVVDHQDWEFDEQEAVAWAMANAPEMLQVRVEFVQALRNGTRPGMPGRVVTVHTVEVER